MTRPAGARLTVALVGLGPGPEDAIPPANWDRLAQAHRRLVTTALHPVCRLMRECGLDFEDLTPLLASCSSQEEALQRLAAHLLELANGCPSPEVVLAVATPGHPLNDHLPVQPLRQALEAARATVEVWPAPGQLDGLHQQEEERLAGGFRLLRPGALEPRHLEPAVTQVIRPVLTVREGRQLAVALQSRYPAGHPVFLWRLPGFAQAEKVQVKVGELPERSEELLTPLTWIVVPPAPSPADEDGVAALYRAGTRPDEQAEEQAGVHPAQARYPLDPLVDVMARLRGPQGCPWDREQDHRSLRPYMIEEAYEAVDAIDSGDTDKLVEELGDVLLQVVFHSQLGREANRFTINDVIRRVTDKMIRRHPHVFGDLHVEDSAEVLRNWEAIKQREPGSSGGKERNSLLKGIPRHLPALVEAEKVQERAARVGFQWPHVDGALAKVEEEWQELMSARQAGDARRINQEWGDLLFALVNVARYLGVDSELALREATAKFRRRFQYIEEAAWAQGRDLREMTLEEMDALWDAAKEREEGTIEDRS